MYVLDCIKGTMDTRIQCEILSLFNHSPILLTV